MKNHRKNADGLRPKQRRFVEEYLVDLNAAAAYRRAGYQARNDNVARVEAHRLLTNPNVAAAIAAAQKARSERTEITQDYVLRRLKEEAELTGEGASHSARVNSLRLLGQHLGLFAERHEHTGKDGAPIELNAEVNASHDLADDLKPYLAVLADFAASPGGEVPPGAGPQQPLDSPSAAPEAGSVPAA